MFAPGTCLIGSSTPLSTATATALSLDGALSLLSLVSKTMQVWLLSGTEAEPGFQAWSLNHPGLATWAPTKGGVLDRFPRKLDAHLRWMADHELPSEPVDVRRVEVVEQVSGHEPLFGHDREPATVEEIDLAIALLRASHHDLIELLDDMPGGFLNREPPYRQFAHWADWRTVSETLAHLANAESHYYLAMIGCEPQGAMVTSHENWRDYLPTVRRHTVEHLGQLRSAADRARVRTLLRRSRRAADGAVEEWSVRKALRRVIRHDLLHTRSIRRVRREWEAAESR